MATVVDELVVKLGLDAKAFTQGKDKVKVDLEEIEKTVTDTTEKIVEVEKEAADRTVRIVIQNQVNVRAQMRMTSEASVKTAKEMQAGGDRAAEFFTKIKTEALSLIGVLLGGRGFEAFARDTTRSLADLGRQALNIGEAAPAVEAFAMAIERMGGNAASARGVLQNFSQAQADFVNFGKGNFGVDMALIGGNLDTKPLEAIQKFMAYIERERNKPGGIQRINAINREVFGLDESTMNALLQIGTVSNLNREIQRSYELGTPTQEQIDRATRMQTAFIGLGQAAETAGRNLLSDLAPGLTAVADGLSKLISEHPGYAEVVLAITGALTALSAVRISANLMGLTGVVTALDGLTGLLARVAQYAPWLLLTGPAGGEDPEFSEQKNQEFLRNRGTPSQGAPLHPDVEAEVRRQASLRGLDPDHMVRLAQKEGGGYYNVSPMGAFGPMQLMPATAADYGVHPGDPWQKNVRGGMDYYYDLLQRFQGNYAAADAAYNAGPNNPGVKRFFATGDPSGLPAETRDYVNSINQTPNGVPPTGPLFGPQHPSGNPPHAFTPQQLAPVPPPPPPPPPLQPTVPNITIGTINLPGVTDAKRFAADLPGALVNQANRGLA